MSMDDLLVKKIRLGDELENSCKQIIAGLKELQTVVQDTDYYFIAFQLLDNGFERLLKCAICYGWLKEKQSFPRTKDIKTHDITILLHRFLSDYFSQRVPALIDDYKFLSKDIDVQETVKVFL